MNPMMTAGSRMLQANLDAWRLGWQMTETLVASQAVIGTRMMMIGAGMTGNGEMPLAEMSRFLPEKTAAFGQAHAGAAQALAAAPKRTGAAPVQKLGLAFADDGLAMLDLVERSIAISTAWWSPLHAGVTANARRLGRKKR